MGEKTAVIPPSGSSAPDPVPATRGVPSFVFGFTIVLSAFLLFQVQPLIAKLILPWFGGTAAVWTTCMLFFQIFLLAGYGYAHWLTRQPGRRAAIIHASLLAVSLLSLPIFPSSRWKPAGGADPLLGILGLLCVTVGLPYFLLSSTSPLLQAWYSRTKGGAMPWRFFALSNAGSAVGLLSYPFIIEPWLANHTQANAWSGVYAVFAIACAGVAFSVSRGIGGGQTKVSQTAEQPSQPTFPDRLLWIGLAACASALLLSVTNHITQNIAAIPLFWVLPLSLYLFSFILCFDSDTWYRRRIFVVLGPIALLALVYGTTVGSVVEWSPKILVGMLCAAAFTLFMVCHGELARRRPQPAHLTTFYLMISVGGAVGGLFVAAVAPVVFNALYELPIVVSVSSFLFAFLLWRSRRADERPETTSLMRSPSDWIVVVAFALLAAAYGLMRIVNAPTVYGVQIFVEQNGVFAVGAVFLLLLFVLWRGSKSHRATLLAGFLAATVALLITGLFVRSISESMAGERVLARNLYGALMVYEPANTSPMGPIRVLAHGTVVHGQQFLQPQSQRYPTSYYAPKSGIGITLLELMKNGPIHVGVIGLGTGTIASYARPGDRYRFYEINPLVAKINTEQFTFLSQCPCTHDLVLGDARLSLEAEPPQQFDVLAVDAFSGDAIPVHLLTREAFQLFWRHIKPDGVLAVHISNRYLDLGPVVLMAAFESGKEARRIWSFDNVPKEEKAAEWVLVTNRNGFFDLPALRGATIIEPISGLKTWTDDYSNLYKILR